VKSSLPGFRVRLRIPTQAPGTWPIFPSLPIREKIMVPLHSTLLYSTLLSFVYMYRFEFLSRTYHHTVTAVSFSRAVRTVYCNCATRRPLLAVTAHSILSFQK
jgi:hypothetical protein